MRKQGKKQQPIWLNEGEVDALLCADLHLRSKRPVGRQDDFKETMVNKLRWILATQLKYECPVLAAGDIFNHSIVNPDLLTLAEKYLPAGLIAIPGQHDLPNHSFNRFRESALYHIYKAGMVHIPLEGYTGDTILAHGVTVKGFPFDGELYTPEDLPEDTWNVALVHQFLYRGRKPWPGCEAERLKSVLDKLHGFHLIVVGDNHKPFTYRSTETHQVIVNCGSMMRTTADQVNYRPRIWAWNAGWGEVWPLYIPIDEEAINREHLEKIEVRDQRIAAFVARLTGDFDAGLSFENNLANFFRANEIRPIVKDKVYQTVGIV